MNRPPRVPSWLPDETAWLQLSQLIAKLQEDPETQPQSDPHSDSASVADSQQQKQTQQQAAAAKTSEGQECVDVRPIDGRLLLFWSDRRTPEVLPLSQTAMLKDGRVAVTCWYYDAAERAAALAGSGETAETLLSSAAAAAAAASSYI